MFNYRPLIVGGALVVLFAGCDASTTDVATVDTATEARMAGPEAQLSEILDEINTQLAADGAHHLAMMAEWIGDPSEGAMGGTVIAKDVGNKQLTSDFVPEDARRTWGAPDGGITYAIDITGDAVPFAGGLSQAETDAAIERSIAAWADLSCSELPLVRVPFGGPIGPVVGEALVADVMHSGWRDLEFGGGVIGVTFTFIWLDAPPPLGNPTDVDNNGKLDTAFRDIYYDPFVGFFGPPRVWTDDGVSNIDVQTVATHEMGHGLSQAHFGTVRFKNNGDLQRSPAAVMNAVYAGPLRDLQGTDNGGHCSNWGQWPNN